jgi:hemin uptake protein HemP
VTGDPGRTAERGEARDHQAPARSPAASAPRRLSSVTLFGGDREVVILHNGQEYRLQVTKADKLILTK